MRAVVADEDTGRRSLARVKVAVDGDRTKGETSTGELP